MHQPIPVQGKWLRQVITGHFACSALHHVGIRRRQRLHHQCRHRSGKQAIAARLKEIDVLVDETADDNGAMPR